MKGQVARRDESGAAWESDDMSKSKKKHSSPNLPAQTLLRSRLEGLWQNPALAGQSPEQIAADLQAVMRGAKPELAVSTALQAFQAAPPEAQKRLEEILPGWLERENLAETLERSLADGALPAAHQQTAARWLAAVGRVVPLPSIRTADTFHSAYELDDGSQAVVVVLWHTDARKTRAQGMEFLIDYNPPWDGAVKDIMFLPKKTAETLVARFVRIWDKRGQPMTPIGAAEARRKLLTALASNRASGIRLPRDLILYREQFFQHVLVLPESPGAPLFTVEDFHALSQAGESPEAISAFEQTVGRRIRMEDGKELFIDASIANMGQDEWDDEEA